MFVVPLNALLQESGHESIGSGNALAVQNFVEKLSMLVMVGIYKLAISVELGVNIIIIGFEMFI